MIKGMFWAAGQLYDLDFKENTGTVPVFHPDVRTFEVTNRKTGKVVGLFYLDTYARDGQALGRLGDTYRSRVRPARRQHRARLRTTTISPSRGRASRC